MRNAPSVVFPVGRCAFYGQLLIFLGILGLLALAGWWLTSGLTTGAILIGAAGAVLWLFWVFMAWRNWRQLHTGVLQWDARAARQDNPLRAGAWRWCPESPEQGELLLSVEVVLDLQRMALLRLRHVGSASRWVWVERSLDPARWNDLRRALTWAGA